MAFAAGVFSLVSGGNPVVTGTIISSTWANNTLNDIAQNGLSLCMLKDGSQIITANIPMNSFKFTGLAVGSSAADSARFDQIQAGIQLGTSTYLTGVAGTNTVTATATPTPAYTIGQRFTFIPAVTNTGATTLNISGVGAGAVKWAGAALTGGELVATVPVTVLVTAATPVFEIVAETQFPDTRALIVGGADATKKARFDLSGLTTGTTRALSVPDQDSGIGVFLGAEAATTSGTTINYTSVPAWVKKITINFLGVSTNGTSDYIIQIGDSGGLENSGYLSGTTRLINGAAVVIGSITTGYGITATPAANSTLRGSVVLTLENSSTFTWIATATMWDNVNVAIHAGTGSKSLSAALDRITLTTANGTDAFDAGAINVIYE